MPAARRDATIALWEGYVGSQVKFQKQLQVSSPCRGAKADTLSVGLSLVLSSITRCFETYFAWRRRTLFCMYVLFWREWCLCISGTLLTVVTFAKIRAPLHLKLNSQEPVQLYGVSRYKLKRLQGNVLHGVAVLANEMREIHCPVHVYRDVIHYKLFIWHR